jgi:hypothetical protein
MATPNSPLSGLVKDLSRNQAGLLGCAAGYVLGLISGPLFRLLLTIGILILFGLVARQVEKIFESKLGVFGIVAAILACTSMGPIQKWFGNSLGNLVNQTSKFALAIVGTYFALQLFDRLNSTNNENPANQTGD